MAVLKDKTVLFLRELQARDHFQVLDRTDQKNCGRYYYLKENGAKRYVRHDPIAMLMRGALIDEDFETGKLSVNIWAEVLLREVQHEKDLSYRHPPGECGYCDEGRNN